MADDLQKVFDASSSGSGNSSSSSGGGQVTWEQVAQAHRHGGDTHALAQQYKAQQGGTVASSSTSGIKSVTGNQAVNPPKKNTLASTLDTFGKRVGNRLAAGLALVAGNRGVYEQALRNDAYYGFHSQSDAQKAYQRGLARFGSLENWSSAANNSRDSAAKRVQELRDALSRAQTARDEWNNSGSAFGALAPEDDLDTLQWQLDAAERNYQRWNDEASWSSYLMGQEDVKATADRLGGYWQAWKNYDLSVGELEKQEQAILDQLDTLGGEQLRQRQLDPNWQDNGQEEILKQQLAEVRKQKKASEDKREIALGQIGEDKNANDTYTAGVMKVAADDKAWREQTDQQMAQFHADMDAMNPDVFNDMTGNIHDQVTTPSRANVRPTSQWTADEEKRFYILAGTGNQEAADQYALELNRKYQDKTVAEKTAWHRKSGAAADLGLVGKGIMDVTGLGYMVASAPSRAMRWANNLQEALSNDGNFVGSSEPTFADYADAFVGGRSEQLNKDYGEIIGGKGWGDLYQLTGSMAQSMVYGNLVGEAGTLLLFFGQAADSSFTDAIDRGASAKQAAMFSVLSGLAEVAGEKFSLENLLDDSAMAMRSMWKNILIQGGVEGSEEAFTDVLNQFGDLISARAAGGKTEMEQKIAERMANGESYDDAKRAVWKEFVESVAWDAIGGAISGAGSGAMQTGINSLRSYDSDIYGADAKQLAQEAKAAAQQQGDRKLERKAQRAETRLEKGKNISINAAGELVRGTNRAAMVDAVEQQVNKRGKDIDSKTARSLANAIVSQVRGDSMSDNQRKLIRNNQELASKIRSELESDEPPFWATNIGVRGQEAEKYGARENKEGLDAVFNSEDTMRVDTKDGAKGTIVGAVKDKNGNVTAYQIRDDGGKVTEVKADAAGKNKSQQAVIGYLTGGAYSEQKIANIQNEQNVVEYSEDFELVAELFGNSSNYKSFEDAWKAIDGQTALTKAQARAAWEAGQAVKNSASNKSTLRRKGTGEVRFESFTEGETTYEKPTQEEIDAFKETARYQILTEVAKAAGVDLVFFKAGDAASNGKYLDSTVYLNMEATARTGVAMENYVMLSAAHELTHFLREKDPAAYADLKDYVVKQLIEKGKLENGKTMTQLIRDKQDLYARNGQTLSVDDTIEEIVADACEMMLRNNQELMRLQRQKAEVHSKIGKWMARFVEKLNAAFVGVEASHAESKAMQESAEFFKELQKKWSSAVFGEGAEISEIDAFVPKEAKLALKGDPTKVTRADVLKLVELCWAGKFRKNSYIPVRVNTPRILIDVVQEHSGGKVVVQNLPMAMRAGHVVQEVETATKGSEQPGEERAHGLTPEQYVELLELLDDPNQIILQKRGNYAEIIHYTARNGQKYYAAFNVGEEITPTNIDTQYMNDFDGGMYNLLLTLFSPEEFNQYVSNNLKAVAYDREKDKSGDSQRGSGGQSPSHLNESPFYEPSIAELEQESNRESELFARELEDFPEWAELIKQEEAGKSSFREDNAIYAELSRDTQKALSSNGLTIQDGIVVTRENAELMQKEGYQKPEDWTEKFSIKTEPAWRANYLQSEGADPQVAAMIQNITNWMTANDAIYNYMPHGEYADSKFGPIRPNQEYIVTFDMDTSCPRTFQYIHIRDQLQRFAKRPLTFNESVNLLNIMKQTNQMIPCTYCYVENKRILKSNQYLNYFAARDGVMSAKDSASAKKLMYSYNAKKGTLGQAAQEVFNQWRNDVATGRAFHPSAAECWDKVMHAQMYVSNWLDGMLQMKQITVDTPQTELLNKVYEKFKITDAAAQTEVKNFVDQWLYETKAETGHNLALQNIGAIGRIDQRYLTVHNAAMQYANSSSSARSVDNYVPYTDQLKNISEENRAFVMGMGGIRKHSSNDFRMDYVQDYLMFYADLAAGKWTGHTYSKSVDFCKIFGRTGDRINLSIAFDTQNGKVVMNDQEGANWKDARELRQAYYDNLGTMAMVTDDLQLSYALNADWIDMIIPFHASGLPKAVWRNMKAWNDYTSKQLEKYLTAKEMRAALKARGVSVPSGMKAAEVAQLYNEEFGIKFIYDEKTGKRKRPHFYPNDTYVRGPNGEMQLVPGHHNDVETYFRLCDEYGVHPRFYGLNVTDAQGNVIPVTEHENYLKLIKETARTETEQKPIEFNLDQYDDYLGMSPMDYVMDRLQQEAKSGGYENMKVDPAGIIDLFQKDYIGKDRPIGYISEGAQFKIDAYAGTTAYKEIEANALGLNNTADLQKLHETPAAQLLHQAMDELGVPRKLSVKEQEAIEVEQSDVNTKYSIREEDPPKRTMIGYKVFKVSKKNPGQLYPTKVENPGGQGTPLGVWLNADTGEIARNPDGSIKTNTRGRISVEADGGTLAWRPGWHLGSLPEANQMNRVDPNNPESNNSNRGTTGLMWDNYVFCECEFAADEDYQLEAFEYGTDAKGKYNHTQAGLPYIPRDGYYKYRTNPDPSTAPWFISGAIKITKILDDDMRREVIDKWNAEHPDEPMRFTERYSGGKINLEEYGLKAGPVTPSTNLENVAPAVDYSDEIRNLPGYTRHALNFNDPKVQEAFRIQQIEDQKDAYIERYNRTHKAELEGRRSIREDEDTYIPYNRRAVVSEETLDRWMDSSHFGASNPNYAQAYITYMKPDDFLDLTTIYDRGRIRSETEPLDESKLKASVEYDPIKLKIDSSTGEVLDHEGRHRMMALMRAGVERVPVLLFDFKNKNSKVRMDSLLLRGQEFNGMLNSARVTVSDIIPLNQAHRQEIIDKFSKQESYERSMEKLDIRRTMRFSLKDNEGVTDRELLANTLYNAAQNPGEKRRLTNYKNQLDEFYATRDKLAVAEDKLREARHTGDANQIRKAQIERDKLSAKLVRIDSKLLELQATKPLKELLSRVRSDTRTRTRAQQRERKSMTDLRHKIRNLHEQMGRQLTNPKENRYVPKPMLKSVAELLEMINTDSGRSEKTKAKLMELQAEYAKIKDSNEYGYAYDDTVAEMLQKVGEMLAGKDDTSIYQMKTDELQLIYDTMKAVNHTVRTAVRMINYETNKNIFEIAQGMMQETDSASPINSVLFNKWLNASMRPETFFKRMAGYRKDSNWSMMADMLNSAQRQQTQIQMEGAQIFEDLMRDTKALDNLTDHKRLVDIGLKDSNGNAVEVTMDMALMIYLHTLNEQNTRHLLYGGLTVPNLKEYYTGRASNAYAKNVRVYAYGPQLSELNHQLRQAETEEQKAEIEAQIQQVEEEAFRWVDTMRSTIEGKMGTYEKNWIKAAQKFFNEYSQKVLNETTMAVYGFEKARVENYVPIHTDAAYRTASFESISRDMSLENSGFMKDRVIGAANPMLLEGLVDVISLQIDNVAKYAAMMPAVRNFSKVYGKSMAGYTGSIQESVRTKFGNDALKYIENIIADLQGARTVDGGLLGEFADKLRGNLAAASLTLNPRVTLGQAASYPTAAAVVGWSPLLRAFNDVGENPMYNEQARQEIAKWSPLMWYRMQGFFDQSVGDIRSSSVGKVMDKMGFLTKWIEAADGWTVGQLWYAAQYYVEDNTRLERGSDAFMEETAKVFNRIVEQTQPNYTAFQRPDILRNPNAIVKQLTMFMTQRLQNANILYDAIGEYNAAVKDYRNGGKYGTTEEDVQAARQGVTRAVTSQVAAAATITAFKLLADALMYSMKGYRDDDDELTKESIIKQLLENGLESLASNFLWGSELYAVVKSILTGERYYGISLSGVDTFSKALEDFVKLTQDPSADKFKALAKDAAQVAGIPLTNLEKFKNAIMYRVKDAQEGNGWGTYASEIQLTDEKRGKLLYQALVDGNTEKAQKLYDYFGNKADANDQVAKYIKSEYSAGNMDPDDAVEALQKYADLSKYDSTLMISKLSCELETGIKYDDLKEKYLEGEITEDKAAEYRALYGMYDEEEAEATVQQWKCEKDTGYSYENLADYVAAGDLSKEEAIDLRVKYGGQDQDAATKTVSKWMCEIETGIPYSQIEEYYADGVISKKDLISYYQKYGLYDADKANQVADKREFIGTDDSLADVSLAAVDGYYGYCEDADVDKRVYLTAYQTCWNIRADKDKNGKTINGSALKKKLAYIGGLNLQPHQKTAVALAIGITEKQMKKWKAPWL